MRPTSLRLPSSFSFLFLSDGILHSSGLPETSYVTQDGFELLVLPPPFPG